MVIHHSVLITDLSSTLARALGIEFSSGVLMYRVLSIYFQLGARGLLYYILPMTRARDRSPMLRGPARGAMPPTLWLHEDHMYSKRPDRLGVN